METLKTRVIKVQEKNLKVYPVDVTKPHNPNRPYSDALLYFFIFLQVVVSYDFGFLKCKSTKGHAVKIMSISSASYVTIAIGIYSMTEYNVFKDNTWVYFLNAHYLFVVLRLFFNKRLNSFCSFLKRLSTIDHKMNCRIKYSDLKIIGICTALVIYKVILETVHCVYITKNCTYFFAYTFISFVISPSIDIHLVLYCLSFHFVLCRMKVLKDIIKDSNESITGHVFYKCFVEIIEKYRKCFDVLYVGYLLFMVPDAMFITFLIIEHSRRKSEQSYILLMVYSNWVLHRLIILIVPAVIGSRLAREVHKIKIILHDKLLLENAKGSKAKDIRNFLMYIEARPMKFYICSVIPLNSTLPFLALNLFVTYLIVAVQLSHIY